jgi:putative transposase
MRTVAYPSDLTIEQWKLIKPMLPKTRVGKPHVVNLKFIFNAILYLLHTGCQWRYLPKSFPNWNTVYYYFSKWCETGFWEMACRKLHKSVRVLCGKNCLPTCALIDSQSVRASNGESRAYDGFKKVRGRKRNIMTDTLGIVIGCKVHAANLPEAKTGKEILDKLPVAIKNNLQKIIADKGYRGALTDYAEYYHGKQVLITDKSLIGTNLKPLRWIVERTFAWFNNYRRMSRDYERKVVNSESMIYLCMLHLLLRRLAG